MLETLLDSIDISFKWLLLAFNFLTILFVYLHKRKNPKTRTHPILFILAHPDDQTMFFRPTIANLRDTYLIHLLCLTGKGTVRERELQAACRVLRVDRWRCVGDGALVDGIGEIWEAGVVQGYVRDYVKENGIKAIFCFDDYGVSGHPNHISIHSTLKSLQVPQPQPQPTNSTLKIYYLESTNLLRKYSGPLQLPIALLKSYSWLDFSLLQAYRAMAQHRSQFVWYRRLWVLFSRYSYINTYGRAFVEFQGQDEEKEKVEKVEKVEEKEMKKDN